MTVTDIKNLLKAADPAIRRAESASMSGDYTIWEQVAKGGFKADNAYDARKLSFEVRRYTHSEADAVADAIDAALNGCGDIAYTWQTSPIAGTSYIRHTFACEAILTDPPPAPTPTPTPDPEPEDDPDGETDSQGA